MAGQLRAAQSVHFVCCFEMSCSRNFLCSQYFCFNSMAATLKQGRQDTLGAPVWMCMLNEKWGEQHWAQPVEFTWTAPTAPQVTIMDSAPAPKAPHLDKGPMHYKIFVKDGYQENQVTKAHRTVKRFCPCEYRAVCVPVWLVKRPAMLAQFDRSNTCLQRPYTFLLWN